MSFYLKMTLQVNWIKLPVVPARGGAEVALGI